MSEVIIQVRNLGKLYRIGERQSYKTLRDTIVNAFAVSLRRLKRGSRQKDKDLIYIWALKDVSFQIRKGEVVGVIGRNGAGKSTLLKVLSRITPPTEGYVEVQGRIGSLLEVGTGFHPELTGRDNIYLNGAILSMKKQEIKRKFDEIVAFAEIEKFIDTPIKHYSSGMYVRLAFAVAAHLEPEILLVDEVLAVGDVAFQKKCLGKMGDVAKEGRTVLFVSHNIGAVQQLCDRCILLEEGKLKVIGMTDRVLRDYIQTIPKGLNKSFIRKGNKKIMFEDFFITDKNRNKRTDFFIGDTVCVNFSLRFNEKVKSPVIAIEVKNSLDESFAHIINIDDNFFIDNAEINKKIKIKVDIPGICFTPSTYFFSLWVGDDMGTVCDYLIDCISIELIQGDAIKRTSPYPTHVKVVLNSKWQTINE